MLAWHVTDRKIQTGSPTMKGGPQENGIRHQPEQAQTQ